MKPQEIIGIYEAYQQVYAQPQNEEVEAWVNALIEEGYDLSEYTWDDMYDLYLDEARRADREGHQRGTPANPTNRNVPTGDPSQRSMLHSKLKRRADEMGRERRSSAAYRDGSRPPVSKQEKAFLRASDRTRQSVSNPPVPDTGRHAGVSRYDRQDSSNPKRNPRHNANRENAAESFDLFDYLLEHLVVEGYADTNQAALAIMANMSEEWKQSIVEDIRGLPYNPNPVGNAIRTGAGLLKSVMSNPSVQGAVKTGSEMLKKKAPTGGYSTRPGDGKPYADGPLWDGPETTVKKPNPQPQRRPQAPMRDEPLW